MTIPIIRPHRRPLGRLLLQLAAGLVAVLVLSLGTTSVASAQPRPTAVSQTSDTPVSSSGYGSQTTAASLGQQCVAPADLQPAVASTQAQNRSENLKLLPLSRWSSSSSGALHTRLGAGQLDDIRQKVSRDVLATGALSIGNSMWQVTGGLVQFATDFSVLDKVGCTADFAAAGLGSALGTGLVPLLVAIAVAMLLYRAFRGSERPMRKVGTLVLTLGVFYALLFGAQQTRSRGAITAPSPAYIAISIDNVVTNLASAPTNAMSSPSADVYGKTGTKVTGDALNCANYVAGLRKSYKDGQAHQGNDGASIPIAVSAMWEQSGLAAFIGVQYGQENPFGERSYCHLLERASGQTLRTQMKFINYGPSGVTIPDGTDEMFSGGNNSTEDEAGVFYAACMYDGSSWTVLPGWDKVTDGTISKEGCAKAWASWDGVSSSKNGFNWTDSASASTKRTKDPAAAPVRDFMLNWHGDVVSSALSLSIVYAISSIVMMVVFGGIALGVIIAKIVGVVMVVMIFLMLTVSLLPTAGDNSKLGRYVKFWVGITLFSAALGFVLSLVALVTGFVNSAGVATFGAGSLLSVLWMGFSPVTAVLVLHMVMKQTGMPSPFKPSAALAWGGAIGATGAGIGAGLDRAAHRGRSYAQSALQGRTQGRYSRNKNTSTTRGRSQKMAPGTEGTPSAGTPGTTATGGAKAGVVGILAGAGGALAGAAAAATGAASGATGAAPGGAAATATGAAAAAAGAAAAGAGSKGKAKTPGGPAGTATPGAPGTSGAGTPLVNPTGAGAASTHGPGVATTVGAAAAGAVGGAALSGELPDRLSDRWRANAAAVRARLSTAADNLGHPISEGIPAARDAASGYVKSNPGRIAKRAAVAGAALAWTGVGGAAALVASPLAIPAAAAIGGRALWRNRGSLTGRQQKNGRLETMREAGDRRVANYRTARAQREAAAQARATNPLTNSAPASTSPRAANGRPAVRIPSGSRPQGAQPGTTAGRGPTPGAGGLPNTRQPVRPSTSPHQRPDAQGAQPGVDRSTRSGGAATAGSDRSKAATAPNAHRPRGEERPQSSAPDGGSRQPAGPRNQSERRPEPARPRVQPPVRPTDRQPAPEPPRDRTTVHRERVAPREGSSGRQREPQPAPERAPDPSPTPPPPLPASRPRPRRELDTEPPPDNTRRDRRQD